MSNNINNIPLTNIILSTSTPEINSNLINTKELTFLDIIKNDVDLTMTNIAANQNGHYTPVDQSAYQDNYITQIGISVATEVTFTIFILDGVNTSKARVVNEIILNLKKDQTWYDFNIYLPVNMSLSFCKAGVDTGNFKYTSQSSKKFYYNSGQLNAWATATGDLNFGVKVKSTHNLYHPLKGKNFCVIGDSISTFWSYNGGANGRYPIGDVANVLDTWWMQLALQTGAKFNKNTSIGGTLVTQTQTTDTGSLQARLETIPDNTEICFIAMGTNDLGHGKELGTFNPTKTTFDLSIFSDAVSNAIINLQKRYPKTKFIWVTPLKRFDGTKDAAPYINNGQTIQTYTDCLVEICNFYGWECINMTQLGINYINQATYLADGLHPNKLGMSLMAEYIKNSFR